MRDKPTVIVTARKPRPRTLAKPAAASPMPARIVTARKPGWKPFTIQRRPTPPR
jgi:hypothetical protein